MYKVLILAVLLGQAETAPPLEVEAVVSGDIATLTAKTEGKSVVFLPRDAGLILPVPPTALKDKVVVFTGPSGTYRVQVITAIKDEVVVVEKQFTLAGLPPVPPLPPIPVPPAPDEDVILKAFQAAYDREPQPFKKGQLMNMIGLYMQMVDEAGDTKNTSFKQLFEYTKQLGKAILMPEVLVDLRTIIASHLATQLGAADERLLDPAGRARAAQAYQSVVSVLKRIKS